MAENVTPVLQFDGASRGNPGPAAVGWIIKQGSETVSKGNSMIGEATNNEAEYEAVIAGLEAAKNAGISTLQIEGDSQLILNQLQGKWETRATNLKKPNRTASDLIEQFDSVCFKHVSRHENTKADSLANAALDN